MYLRVNEQRYAAQLNSNNDIEIFYSNINTLKLKSDFILIDHYVCLFDNDWNIIDEVWEYLQNRLQLKRLAFNTIATKGSDLKLFYDFLDQYKLSYSAVSHKYINDFIAWLMLPDQNKDLMQLNAPSKRTAKSVNRIVSTIRDFYKYHEAVNAIKNPFVYGYETIKRPTRQHKSFYQHTQNSLVQKSTFKIKEFDRGIRVLSKDQIEIILNACKMERDRLLFELLLFTGIRIGEALSLDIQSIGISQNISGVQEIRMKPNNDDFQKGSRYRQQKTGIRNLFIPTQLMNKLSDYYERVWLKIYEQKEMAHELSLIHI